MTFFVSFGVGMAIALSISVTLADGKKKPLEGERTMKEKPFILKVKVGYVRTIDGKRHEICSVEQVPNHGVKQPIFEHNRTGFYHKPFHALLRDDYPAWQDECRLIKYDPQDFAECDGQEIFPQDEVQS